MLGEPTRGKRKRLGQKCSILEVIQVLENLELKKATMPNRIQNEQPEPAVGLAPSSTAFFNEYLNSGPLPSYSRDATLLVISKKTKAIQPTNVVAQKF